MRVIGGTLKGTKIQAPEHLPVRPTTDMAKEALFNILHNQYTIANAKVLDLFSGTGNIALEFLSRGAGQVKCIDNHQPCVKWIQQLQQKYQLQMEAVRMDVFQYLKNCNEKFDFIFADPPYHLLHIPEIVNSVFEHQLLQERALLIVEHQSLQNLSHLPNFQECRKYGNSTFSFFRKNIIA